MLKFAAGVVCGWVAARSLSPSVDAFATPSLDELTLLAQKAKKKYDDIIKKIDETPNQK